ncbi:caspase family protein [Burkholderia pyrrocinia]|uniref:caspase family protein n=1 Tax=Burkholderia pyrrocinia TaxID=60550 RepID=UPI000ACA313B|nr:caspase family protein [Burkholderia pyrrocinia]
MLDPIAIANVEHLLRHHWTQLGRARRSLLVVASLACCGASAPLPARIALVIGNTHYTALDPLPNALADAKRLAKQLQQLGFALQPDSLDLDQSHLTAAVAAFGDRLRSAGPNAVGFFYYAGHAAQDEFGVNYLLPIDARARTPADVRTAGTPLPPLLLALEDANTPVNIVVLDACRSWYKSKGNPKDPKGLHDMGQHASMLIAYATRAGETADEGPGLSSSPFSRRLIEALEQHGGEPLVLLFDDVKTLVYTDTDAAQSPLLVDGLNASGRWSFASGTLESVPDKPKPNGAATISPFLASLDRAKLVAFFRGRESLADALLKRRDVLAKYAIDSPNRLAYFLGNIGHESGGFTVSNEKFGYSAADLRKNWSNKVLL